MSRQLLADSVCCVLDSFPPLAPISQVRLGWGWGWGWVGSPAGLTSLQSKLEKSLNHLQKQMEDALLFQAQAKEICALWQAGGWVPVSQGWRGGALVYPQLGATRPSQ